MQPSRPLLVPEAHLARELDVLPTKRFSVIVPAKNGVRITLDDKLREGERIQVTEAQYREQWEAEQRVLAQQLVPNDDVEWQIPTNTMTTTGTGGEGGSSSDAPDGNGHRPLRYIGGVDISFVKGDPKQAVAGLVVLDFPALQLVWEKHVEVELTKPYISGFLAFREAEFLVALVDDLRAERPGLLPDVIMVDGNGMLHQRSFGIACHLGVLCGLPTIGVAKKLHVVDGLTTDAVLQLVNTSLDEGQDGFVELRGDSGTVWGAACRFGRGAGAASTKSKRQLKKAEGAGQGKPIFVSVGHRLGLASAVAVAAAASVHKLPEPVRQADLRSREAIRALLG